MCPFALTTAAMAWACGPMMAMDLSGPAAKARPIDERKPAGNDQRDRARNPQRRVNRR